MRLLPFLSLPTLLLVQACSTQGLISAAYPDRQTYKVYSEVMEEEMAYRCAPGATEAETRARLGKANRMFETYVEEEAGKIVENIFSDDDFTRADSLAASKSLNAAAERMVERMDKETECVPVDL